VVGNSIFGHTSWLRLHRQWRLCLLAVVAACSAAPAALAGERSVPGILCGSLLDVRSGRFLKDQLLLIGGDGRITAIQPLGSTGGLPPGTHRLPRLTCLPGLIDVHTHLNDDPGSASWAGLGISNARAAIIGAKNARLTLEAGFTTVRNLGSAGYSDIALRDGIEAGDVPGPRIIASGPPLSITGGHNDQNLLAPEYHYRMEGVADGLDGVRAKVRENIKYGADVIKVMATGGVMSEGDSPGAEQYSLEELRIIVETAHSLGRRVAAHAHGSSGIKDAARAGVDSVEHGSYIDDEGIQLLKSRGTYLVPTLYLGDWLEENFAQLGLTPNMIDKFRKVIPEARLHVARAFHAGVKIAYGTDAGVYPHGQNARQFAILVKLGMSSLQAIQSATVNAADLLGWSDRIGVLEPGKFADVIAVEGDPLSEVTRLEHVAFVMKGGAVYRDEAR
jgi:imidazolonepropionase-like amidohydrolase